MNNRLPPAPPLVRSTLDDLQCPAAPKKLKKSYFNFFSDEKKVAPEPEIKITPLEQSPLNPLIETIKKKSVRRRLSFSAVPNASLCELADGIKEMKITSRL